jgi:hypothetical protein
MRAREMWLVRLERGLRLNGHTIGAAENRAMHLLFFAGCLLIVLFTATWKIDLSILDKSQGYFVHRNLKQANEAGKLGYLKYEVNDYAETFGKEWNWKPGIKRIVRSGPDDFDDVGYISILQLIAIAGKNIDLNFVAKFHNYCFLFSAVIMAFVIANLCRSVLAGWLFLLFTIVLKGRILSLVYGSPDSRTFVIFFPMILFIMLFFLIRLAPQSTLLQKGAVLLFGVIAGIMTSIRHSEGTMVLMALFFGIFLLSESLRKKVVSAVFVLGGYFFITLAMPNLFALHRDIVTGVFDGKLMPYLGHPGRHQTLHPLVGGLGKYPNSFGLRYHDLAVYKVLRERYPEAMDPKENVHGPGYYSGLRNIYIDYVKDHPLEYIYNLSKAFAELFFFVPYATSAGNLPWHYGYLPIKSGVVPEERDLLMGGGALINLSWKYLRIGLAGWGAFALALAVIVRFVRFSLRDRMRKADRKLFLCMGFYLFVQALVRAMVPQHGLSLIVTFWTMAIISFIYMSFVASQSEIAPLVVKNLRFLAYRYYMRFRFALKWNLS